MAVFDRITKISGAFSSALYNRDRYRLWICNRSDRHIKPSIHPSSLYKSTHHQLIYLSIHPWFINQLFINLYTHPSSGRLSNHPSALHQSVVPSVHHPFTHPFIHSFIHPPIHPFIHPSINSSIHLSIHSLVHPFIHSSIHSFIQNASSACGQTFWRRSPDQISGWLGPVTHRRAWPPSPGPSVPHRRTHNHCN